jgi:phosphate transport system substrate-binding protein
MKTIRYYLLLLLLPLVARTAEPEIPQVRFVCVDSQLDLPLKTLALNLAMSNLAMDFSLSKTGHDKAVKSILAGKADIGILTVKPLFKFRRQGLNVKPFAVYPVVWAVNKVNPVYGMTSDQLKRIYRGKITNWKLFNNTNYSFHLFGMKLSTPAMKILQATLLKDIQISVPMYLSSEGTELPELVNGNNYSLAFMPFLPLKKDDKVKYINIDTVKPTPANFLSGKYPYAKVFYIAYKGDHSKSVGQFLEYLKSPAMKAIFTRAGYVLY